MTLEIKKLEDDHAIVAGYGVVFDSLDLEQEYFSKSTNFMLDLVPVKPVIYDHTGKEKKFWLGTVLSVKADDMGLWVEAQIERSREYAEYVLELVKDGRLGWSSGSVGHMVDRLDGLIKQWPIVEFSLTPTPAEPRTLGVEQIKSVFSATGCEVPSGLVSPGEAELSDEQIKQEYEKCLKKTMSIPVMTSKVLSVKPSQNAMSLRKPKPKRLPN